MKLEQRENVHDNELLVIQSADFQSIDLTKVNTTTLNQNESAEVVWKASIFDLNYERLTERGYDFYANKLANICIRNSKKIGLKGTWSITFGAYSEFWKMSVGDNKAPYISKQTVTTLSGRSGVYAFVAQGSCSFI